MQIQCPVRITLGKLLVSAPAANGQVRHDFIPISSRPRQPTSVQKRYQHTVLRIGRGHLLGAAYTPSQHLPLNRTGDLVPRRHGTQ